MNSNDWYETGEPLDEFQTRLFCVQTHRLELPKGRTIMVDRVQRPPGVRVLVTTGDHILMSEEWRRELRQWDWRLPGGKVFDALDEYRATCGKGPSAVEHAVLAAAGRELAEETSIVLPAETFRIFHRSICGASVDWDLYFCEAVVSSHFMQPAEARTTAEGEQIRPCWLTTAVAEGKCLGGGVHEDRTVGVLLRYLRGGWTDSGRENRNE